MNVDLPNLTSIINSEGYSFYLTRSVTLESISEYWILMVFRYSKSSKYQATWFILECSIEINFEYWLFDWFDFIHRCFFHSRWSCQNQAVNLWLRIVQWLAIDQDRFDWLLVCLFQTDSWSQCMILWLSKYQSFLPDYAVFFAIFTMILN